MYTKSAVAGLMAVSVASGASFKLPLSRRETGESNMKPFADDASGPYDGRQQAWTTEIEIGGQKMVVQVDTGSSDLWILSTEMSSADQKNLPKNHFFDPQRSLGFKWIDGGSYDISYSVGMESQGKTGVDNVTIGGDSVNMPFGLCVSQTNSVQDWYDGILGLAFGAFSTQKPKKGLTWIESIAGSLDKPLFTMNLPNVLNGQSVEFGTIDHTLYNGTLLEAKINNGTSSSPQGWTAGVSFTVNGKNISSEVSPMLMDTGGLELTMGDKSASDGYWANVKGAKLGDKDPSWWTFPCNTPSLPDLTYNFVSSDGRTVSATVEGKFLNRTTQEKSSDPSMCDSAMNYYDNLPHGFIGYPFFQSFFTVFDMTLPSVSFAPYPDQELDGKSQKSSGSSSSASSVQSSTASGSSSGSATGSASASASASTTGAKAASASGTASGASATGTSGAAAGSSGSGSGDAKATGPAASGSADAKPAASSSAPVVDPGHSGASGLNIPSLAVALLAVAAGAMTL